jgi:general secretion pathway protein N
MSRRFAATAAAMLAVALLVTLPMRWALVRTGFEAAGLSARAVTGSIWHGTLADAAMRGAQLGDVEARLAVLPLLTGTARVVLSAGAVSGAVERGPARSGVAGINGTVTMAGLGGLPVRALQFYAVDIGFAGSACRTARGRITAVGTGLLAGEGSLVGTPRCDGTMVLLPLVSASGQARLDVRIGSDGRFSGTLALDAVDEVTRTRLLAQGFAATPQGLSMNLMGTL